MKLISRNLKYITTAFATAIIGIAAANAFGQTAVGSSKDKSHKDYKDKKYSFCSNNNWSDGDRSQFRELREMTVAAASTLNVDGGNNGGIAVKGEDRSDFQIRACVQAWGNSEEAARALASNVRIDTSGTVKAQNSSDDRQWSVSYQILVPRGTNLNLKAHNGGISISETDGSADFETQNGGINLNGVSGDVKGRTTNGGVNVTLSGASWKGSGLDLQTTNGGVRISMPENYAAHVETGTVNGGFRSDIPALNITTENIIGADSRSRSRRIVTNINGGGAPIKVITTNGGVNISTSNRD